MNTLLLLLACGTADDPAASADDTVAADTAAADTEALPFDAPGPWTAATTETTITGASGVELKVQVWYPSTETDGETVTYDGLLAGEALEDLEPDCSETRPVLLFSHGYGGVRWQSPFLTEHLATHGWVVVAPDHTLNTFYDNNDKEFYNLVLRRPQDIADSYDWLLTDAALSPCVDPAAGYAVSGHSFGGYTAFAVGGATVNDPSGGEVDLSDDRVWAVLPMAPWDASGALTDGTAAIEVPVMTLSGTRDTTTSWAQVSGLHDALTVTPRYLGEFPEAGHYSFAPIACAFGTVGNGCGEDYIDEDTFTALVKVAALSFLESSRGTSGAIEQLPAESEALLWTIVE